MKTKSQIGRGAKEKGKVGEREVAALLRKHGWAAHRGQQYSGQSDAPDVKHNIPGLHIEVKRREKFRLWEAMEQAEADAADGDVPVVFHRKSRKKWIVILDAEYFLEMCRHDQ